MHTVNNDYPIFDNNIRTLLKLFVPNDSKEEKANRIKNRREVYQDLVNKTGKFINSETGKKYSSSFYDLPIKNIDKVPKMKACDFCLWILGNSN